MRRLLRTLLVPANLAGLVLVALAGTALARIDLFEWLYEVSRSYEGWSLDELFSGLIWTGEQAKQLGLIDKLGDVDYVARDLVGATSQVDFTVKDNAFDRFAKRLGASAAQQLSMALGFSGVSLR